ncbi:hypothetical protein MNBD_GAMMA08-1850 [hydrothermal vent metagenome]|uniref:Uncharacterized protein n=1 Tax=hydrothermal vent metagenome TaxID=652676 RepID=A0A3B0XVS5_9ZZZZ
MHTIKKQILDFTIGAELDSHAFMQTLSEVNHASIIPMVDTVLSDMGLGDREIILDRLEIDLGEFTSVNLQEDLPARLQAALSENLSQCLNETKMRNDSPAVSQIKRSQLLSSFNDDKTQMRCLDEQQSNLSILQCFIETGLLPWWATHKTQSEMQTILNKILDSAGAEIVQMLSAPKSDNYVRRLVRQFDIQSIQKIIKLFDHSNNYQTTGLIEDWQNIMESDRINTSLPEHILYEAVLSCVVDKKQNTTDITELNKNMALKLAELSEQRIEELVSKVKPIINSINLNNPTIFNALVMEINAKPVSPTDDTDRENQAAQVEINRPQIFNQKNKFKQAAESQTEPVLNEAAKDQTKNIITHTAEKNQPEKQKSSVEKKPDYDTTKARHQVEAAGVFNLNMEGRSSSQPIDAEKITNRPSVSDADTLLQEAIYIENAGMVLLWPFLPAFFSQLGLYANKKFKSDAAQQRAVLILQYLATAQSACLESELLLNKILCAVDPLEPALNKIELTKHEKDESASLLQSVIEQWATLKKTSIAGLQQAFLCRQGRLLKQDNGWNLLIERSAYDMLLDSLPWSISLIRISWMQTTVFVEW